MERPRIDLLAYAEACNSARNEDEPSQSFFKSVQWSADGTTLVASSSANVVSTFILPSDLLDPRQGNISLCPDFTLVLPEPSHVLASSPYFNLSALYTQTSLLACRDHPIQLYSVASSSSTEKSTASPVASEPSQSPPRRPPPLASYPLIRPETEAYLTPTALIWPAPGTHFTVGTTNLLATFDVSRPGAGPISRIPTIPSKRHISKGSGVGMRGTVAALAAQPSSSESNANGLVAAGTWTRWIGLYDLGRGAEAAATWSVAGAVAGDRGRGVVQTSWSPCGRYLVVNERKAAGLLVYDVRVTGKLLGWLAGRSGDTHQRLSCDVFAGTQDDGSFEVWAGTDRGEVAVWDAVGKDDGNVSDSWTWGAGKSVPVGSVAMHGSGSVVATCSGGWFIPNDDKERDDGQGQDIGGLSEKARSSSGVVWASGARLAVWAIGEGETHEEVGLDDRGPVPV